MLLSSVCICKTIEKKKEKKRSVRKEEEETGKYTRDLQSTEE
jgi:hypothetical protein